MNMAMKGSGKACIIAAVANDIVVTRLIEGAKRAFISSGITTDNHTLIRVAGALEIPLMLNKASHHFDLFVVLGAVIKGQSDHYEHVARMANDGVLKVALSTSIPVGNGILTVHSLEQALARADEQSSNLGFDAAMAAVNLWQSFKQFTKNNI